ncbi:MAG: 3-hydroxyacyl-CoA dehydrogenase family protein [Planctomycetota bacterium]|nr:3-hydroxyacyl-CoA dehydrogenase family protein [Planctomycetota bacterium]
MPAKRKSASKLPPPVGVVGLGLMGSSIAACLLAAGHPVAGVALTPREAAAGRRRVRRHLEELRREKLLKGSVAGAMKRLTASADYATLKDAVFVIESIVENLAAKRKVLQGVEAVVAPGALIGSNTSALPISVLQAACKRPGRVLGIHWAEPAHITRFMEIVCGDKTRLACARKAVALAEGWGKEPSLLKRDIRGFIANRCMYACFREAFHLVESGYCTIEDVDRSLRNDVGWWMTFAGPFRYMDLTGVPAYAAVMKDLWPTLSRRASVPKLIRRVVRAGGKGVANGRGFYRYTRKEARAWEAAFWRFNCEIRKLALKYGEKR